MSAETYPSMNEASDRDPYNNNSYGTLVDSGYKRVTLPMLDVDDFNNRTIRAYEDGQYAEAEQQFALSLKRALPSVKDRAAAHKHLAFIYCTSQREAECEAAFRAARQADPAFVLSKSEAGHPQWGPVYKRLR